MEFSEIKADFEAHILKLQDDLKKYASRSDAQESVIEYRIGQINKLIGFYNAFELMVSDLELEVMEKTVAYNKLHADTQKLVTFCELHRVNPNMIFYYSQEELSKMQKAGLRILVPNRRLDTMNPFIARPDDPYEPEDVNQAESDRYHGLAIQLQLTQLRKNNTAA